MIWILLWLTSAYSTCYDQRFPRDEDFGAKYKNERFAVFTSSGELVQFLKDNSISLKEARVFNATEYGLTVVPMEIKVEGKK